VSAKLTPPGGVTRTVETRNESWVLMDRGGLSSLKFDCDLSPGEREELVYGTEVEFPVPDCDPLIGRILFAGSPTIECGGMQSKLDDVIDGVTYSATKMDGWKSWHTASEGMSLEVAATYIHLKNSANSGGNASLVFEFAAPSDYWRIAFDWSRATQAGYGLLVYTGVVGGDGLDPFTWTAHYSLPTTSLGTSGRYDSGFINTAGIAAIRVLAYTAGTVAAEGSNVYIGQPRVYGSSVTPTMAGVMADIYAKAGFTHTDVAAVATDMSDISFARNAKLTDRVTDVLNRADVLARIEARSDGTGYQPCGVFEARPTTPDTTLFCDGRDVVANIDSLDWANMCSHVRVMCKRPDGGPVHVDIVDTDLSHPLVAAGVTRWASIDIDTTSYDEALAAGNAYIALRNSGVKGTVYVSGRHDFTPGHLIALERTSVGNALSRMRQMNCTLAGTEIVLDDTDSFESWLKRMAK
jgi:hypothetical protein